MSKYTTGEIAKLCGVTVRTVQYYDSRNILVPSEMSEGGRRLYTDDDLKKMRIICFLREIGLPINSIAALFEEKDTESIISVLLEQQESVLKEELRERQKKLELLSEIKKEMKNLENFTVDSIEDISQIIKSKDKLNRLYTGMLITGIPITVLQWTSIILWIVTGAWWLFAVWIAVMIPYVTAITMIYLTKIRYICPECHNIFSPKYIEFLFAYHTPRTRRLTCPKCGRNGLCIEVYDHVAK